MAAAAHDHGFAGKGKLGKSRSPPEALDDGVRIDSISGKILLRVKMLCVLRQHVTEPELTT